ncbi:hypothetical protein O181_002028 [Austropuccinia psidii MF-1]|uniref:Uncharacterized protein n=1 Tax=Austropuccinia psidii MF-1 TaxID=1389203 RepID=A0A9Q3BBY8_9BASI|nr:hypothetical protein [Austropuccinia psidii MF-1]
MEGEAPFRKEGGGPRISNSFSGVVGDLPGILSTTLKGPGEDDAEEKESDGTEAAPTAVGESLGTGWPALAHSDKLVYHQSEPSLLAIIHK